MRIYLVRHGSTEWNERGLWQGVVDTQLSENGRREVERLAQFLRRANFAAIYSSPMTRALQTAEIIATVTNHRGEVLVDERLRECEIRLWNGMSMEELIRSYPNEYRTWSSKLDADVPGVESLKSVQERMYNFLESVALQSVDDGVIIVSHAIALRMLISKVLGIEPPNHVNFALDNASVTILESSSRRFRVALLNYRPSP